MTKKEPKTNIVIAQARRYSCAVDEQIAPIEERIAKLATYKSRIAAKKESFSALLAFWHALDDDSKIHRYNQDISLVFKSRGLDDNGVDPYDTNVTQYMGHSSVSLSSYPRIIEALRGFIEKEIEVQCREAEDALEYQEKL